MAMKKRNFAITRRLRDLVISCIIVGVLVLLTGLGVLERPDLTVSDALYQERVATDGKIVIIGIDEKALDKYVPDVDSGGHCPDAGNVERIGRLPPGGHRYRRVIQW